MKALQEGLNRLATRAVPLDATFKTLTAIIIIRTLLEKLLSPGGLLFNPTNHYNCVVGDLHMYFSWICIFLSMSIPVAVFAGVRYRAALNLTLAGFCVTVSVPLLDYAFTSGRGAEITYFRSFDTLLYNYVNLINPFAMPKGVTAGVRVEVLLVLFGSFLCAVVGFKRGLARSLLLAVSLYSIVYFYGYLLPLHDLLGLDLQAVRSQSSTSLEGSQALFFAYLGPFLLSLIGVALVLARRQTGVGRILLSLLYPSRLLLYLFLLCFGFLFAASQTGTYPSILNRPDLAKLACAAVSISLLFVYAKLVNDLNDLDIDRISNPDRPLVTGLVHPDDAAAAALPTLALSLVLAIPVERDFFYFWCFIWGLSHVYSGPPFRLRRLWPAGHLVLAALGAGLFMAGASIVRPNDFYAVLKDKAMLLYVPLGFFSLCHLKDLKDIQGDRAGGAFNLFGHVSSPRAWALVFLGGFLCPVLLIAALLGLPALATVAGVLGYGGAAILVITRAEKLARLDRLLAVSFVFLLYLSGVWLVQLGR